MAGGLYNFSGPTDEKTLVRKIVAGWSKIQAVYPKSLEQGRYLENSLGDATQMLLEGKQYINDQINSYMNMNTLAVDGMLPTAVRAPKYVVDSTKIIKEVVKYAQDLSNLIRAIHSNIGLLQAEKAKIQGMVQGCLNQLANLMNQICNLRLPALPAIPNFFSNFIFPGFAFPFSTFDFDMAFDKNFAFTACKHRPKNHPEWDIFRNYPKDRKIGSTLVQVPGYNPPFGGRYVEPSRLTDPGYLQELADNTTVPVFSLDFDPEYDYSPRSGYGILPNPNKIISGFLLTRDQYTNVVRSVIPDSTLQNVVSSSFDKNITAAWVIRLRLCRDARRGQWLPKLQSLYNELIPPSYELIDRIPWNNLLGGMGVKDEPPRVLLSELLQAMPESELYLTLILLSYMEEALLGVARNTNWDAALVSVPEDNDRIITLKNKVRGLLNDNISGVVATTSDYHYMSSRELVYDESELVVIKLDSNGLADAPVEVVVPRQLEARTRRVVAMCQQSINNTPDYHSPNPSHMTIYTLHAGAQGINTHSQYWRDVRVNINTLVNSLKSQGDSNLITRYVVNYDLTYWERVDPLAVQFYLPVLNHDLSTRDISWVPGTPELPNPPYEDLGPYQHPISVTPVWDGDNFDPAAFLMRNDIAGLSPNIKLTMMDINEAYASVRSTELAMRTELDRQIDLLTSAVSDVVGVDASLDHRLLGIGKSGIAIPFASINFDTTPSMIDSSHTTVTIPVSGSYILAATTKWSSTTNQNATRTVTLLNGTKVLAFNSQSGVTPVDIPVGTTVELNQGDRISVVASHNSSYPQNLESEGTTLSVLLVPGASVPSSSPYTPTDTTTTTERKYTAGEVITIGTLGSLGTDNKLYKANPGLTTPPWVDAIALTAGGSGAEITVGVLHGDLYKIPGASYTHGPLFLGLDGMPTQTLPSVDDGYQWLVVIGRAITVDTLVLDLQVPIKL